MKNLLLTFIIFATTFIVSAYTHRLAAHEHTDNVQFIENKGQFDNEVQFKAKLNNAFLFLSNNSITYLLNSAEDMALLHKAKHGALGSSGIIRQHAIKVHFEGANAQSTLEGFNAASSVQHYILGNDPDKWATDVPLYSKVRYNNIYDGIDMQWYSQNGQLKYDIIAQQGANISQVSMRYDGADSLYIKNGKLYIVNAVNTIIEQTPFTYQYQAGKLVKVACHFELSGSTVNFCYPEGYNENLRLIVDPEVVFATFSGSNADNWGFTATYDAQGHLYAGSVSFDAGYPTTSGAFDSSFNNPSDGLRTDMAITKFSPDGSNLIYSTFIGGQQTEFPHSLIVDSQNQLCILGSTSSTNFPVSSTAYDATFNGGSNFQIGGISFNGGSDLVAVKLNASGSALVGATFIGGSGNDGLNLADNLIFNYADEARGEVMVDAQDNVYLVSSTQSSNFPTTGGAFSTSFNGGSQDGCLVKLNADLSQLLFSTYIGGSNNDAAYAVKIDENGALIIAGGTNSADFPNINAGADNTFNGGSADGYIVKLNASGSGLINSTFLGTSAYDQTYFVELDDYGNIFTVGQTSGNYFVSPDVYSNNNSGQFIQKLSSDLSTALLSTTFGNGDGDPDLSPTAFLVDICDRIYVSGWGGIANSLHDTYVTNMPTTSNAYKSNSDGNDFYFIVFEEDFASLEYASYFGGATINGAGSEHVDGGTSRFDKQGIIYQAVCAGCGGVNNFPTTPGAWSSTNNSENCNLGVFKFAFELSGVHAATQALPAASGCIPFDVQFQQNSLGANQYFWDFGNGDTSTDPSPLYTFNEPGTYNVSLIAQNLSACNIADTAYTTIHVGSNEPAIANFTATVDCETYQVSLNNLSENANEYLWDFGDGSPILTGANPNYSYSNTGNYTISLTANNTVVGCESTASTTQTLNIPPNSVAAINIQADEICVGETINFNNASVGASTWLWDFGDPASGANNTASTPNASHTFSAAGTYTVNLSITANSTCNGGDETSLELTVYEPHTINAQFEHTLLNDCQAVQVNFTNQSTGSNTYLWDFGDGTTSLAPNPTHNFPAEGNYTVTLTASYPCSDAVSTSQELQLQLADPITAALSTPPPTGCPPLTANVSALGTADSYIWNFGDNNIFTTQQATFTYTESGIYPVQLIVSSAESCNGADTLDFEINVSQYAQAAFSTSSQFIEVGYPIHFTNQSSLADTYLWDFGDGNTSTETSPIYTYAQAGNYEVCLTAINTAGCNDSICQTIEVIPEIRLGVPSGFSPNGDNLNDTFYIEGHNNISELELRIFNRWGEEVFYTTQTNEAWDGTYKNVPQEMEVYVYYARALLISGRQVSLKGNITLLR